MREHELVVTGPLLRAVLNLPDDCLLPWTVSIPIKHHSIPDDQAVVAATFTGCCGETTFKEFVPGTVSYSEEWT